jgi:hypothetical protein
VAAKRFKEKDAVMAGVGALSRGNHSRRDNLVCCATIRAQKL